jgi:hypothetical protein
MSAKNDGYPAFPCHPGIDPDTGNPASGMTLRNYYKAAALQGLASSGLRGNTREFVLIASDLADQALSEDAAFANRNPSK